jgi:hypothetical protein
MMRKTIFLSMLLAIPCCAQKAMQNVAYQQPGWLAAPGSDRINVHITHPEGQTGPVREKPFSATEVRTTKQSLSDGNHIDRTDTSKFYRDAEGRMRDEGEGHVLIFDPVGGETYDINPQTRTYVKWSTASDKTTTTIVATKNRTSIHTTNQPDVGQPVQNVSQAHVPNGAEPVMAYQSEDLGQKTQNGVLCKGTRTTMTIPVSAVGNAHEIKIVDERWYSEDLGALVKSSTNDPRFGVSTYELTNILRTDPDVSLFQVPADYVLKQRSY